MNGPDRRRSPDGMDDEAIFADIVAHLNDDVPEREGADHETRGETTDHETNHETTDHDTTDETTGRDTNHETTDHETTDETTGRDTDHETAEGSGDGDPQAVRTPQVWRAHEVDHEYEEHFEPPPVTPLPVGDLQFWAIITGMVGGPLLLLYLVFFNRDAKSYWILTAIAMSVGGFALLVSRMPGHQGDDDDGARL